MRTYMFLVLSSLLLAGIPISSQAEVKDVNFRYGRGFSGDEFDQFDIAMSMPLEWQKDLGSGWLMHSDLEGILGVLTWDNDTALKLSVMPNLLMTSPSGKLELIAGIGMGVMLGETEFGNDHDLGGPFFLQGNLGVRWYLTESFFAGYRYYHQSNAKIYSNNSSVNLNQVEIGWKF